MKFNLLSIAVLLCLSTAFNSVFANPDLLTETNDNFQVKELERSTNFWKYLINARKGNRFDDFLPIAGGTFTHSGTAQTFIQFRNTGGDFYIGRESSTAGAFFTGSSAYANVLYSYAGPIQNIIGGVNRFEVSSSGVNVNGALTGTSATFSGNVGIGTTSPAYGFDFRKNAPSDWAANIWNTDVGSGLLVRTSATNTSGALGVYNGTSYVLYARNDGNVGVGTSTPESKLDIKNGGLIVDTENNGYGGLKIETTSAGDYNVNFRAGRGGPLDGFRFYTNARPMSGGPFSEGNLRMTLTGTGNLGIGTTSPFARLHVKDSPSTGTIALGNDTYPGLITSSASSGEFRIDNRSSFIGYITFFPNGQSNTVGSEAMRITKTGDVGIGTDDPKGYKLAVAGKVRATEIKVEALPWSDFVFEPSYKLRDLKSTEQFIKENKHLPEIPSAAQVAKDGINVGEMNAKLLQKIEELTLYMIEQNKRSEQQDKIIQLQNERIANLEKQNKK